MKALLNSIYKCRFCVLLNFIIDFLLSFNICFFPSLSKLDGWLLLYIFALVLFFRYALNGILSFVLLKKTVLPSVTALLTTFSVLFAFNIVLEGDFGAALGVLVLASVGGAVSLLNALLARLFCFFVGKCRFLKSANDGK